MAVGAVLADLSASWVIQHIGTRSHVLGSGCLGYIYIQSDGLGVVLRTSGFSTLALQMQKNEVRANLNSVTKVNLKLMTDLTGRPKTT